MDTLTALNPIPLIIVGVVLGVAGVLRRSSTLSLIATFLVTSALWVLLAGTPAALYRGPICYHIMFAACILISIIWRDPMSKKLQTIGSIMLVGSALLMLQGQTVIDVPWEWRLAYVFGLSGIGYVCARITHGRAYWTGLVGTISMLAYAIAVEGYRHASWALGRQSVVAFFWSVGTLIIGMLISAYKARWLPPMAWGNSIGIPVHDTSAHDLQAEEGPQDNHG